ncbi:hypothetical protein BH23GEM5_BH23GEM5_10050 [soil metagenome]
MAAITACAPGAAARAPQPTPLAATEADALAALLRLEDRREWDYATLTGLAAAPRPVVRRHAVLAAGRIRHPSGRGLLLPLLADPDSSVAATAAFALGLLADTTTLTALSSRLDLSAIPETVVAEAAAATGKLGTEGARQALANLLRTAPLTSPARLAIGEALLAIPRTPRGDLAPILRWVETSDPELRWRAAYALARRPDPAATPTLLRLAADPDARVRSFAVRGLTAPLADSSGIGAAQAAAVLRRAAADRDRAVRVHALRSMGTHPDPESIALLAQQTGSTDAWMSITAAESLGRLGPHAAAAAPALERATTQERPIALRSAALLALASVLPARASALAVDFAGEPGWRARVAAARAHGALRSSQSELLPLVRDRDARVAAAALESAVAAAGDPPTTVRPLLIGGLASPDVMVRAAALAGFAKLAEPSTLPLLLDAYGRSQADTLNDAGLAAVDAIGAVQRRGGSGTVAFFARFPTSPDPLVRGRVARELGGEGGTGWGAPQPIETDRSKADYRALVERGVVPGSARHLPRARIVTDSGTVEIELFASEAPLTVENFLRLARSGYFANQEWPRVVANFVVQGGDPRGDTSGGPGYAIRDEINRHRYLRGTLGMALSGPDTGGSQWFITHSPQPHLDGGYTVFGRVVSGMDVVDRVAVGDRIRDIQLLP